MNKQMKIFNSNTCRFVFAVCLSALCFVALSTHAATISVTNTNDSGVGSLRQALADAVDGDTINFDSSLNGQAITLTSGELLVNKSITINGPGPNNLSIDGNHASGVFHVSDGATATITGLTISNGSASFYGGGIFNDHSTLTVRDCVISGNSAMADGGGIHNNAVFGSAAMTITNTTLSGNSAGSNGGGIYNDGFLGSATLEVSNSTLSGNAATYSGAIGNEAVSGSATLRITNSTLSGNSASFLNAGGIYNYGYTGSATLEVFSSTFNGNSNWGIVNVFAASQLGSTIFHASRIGNNSGTVMSLGYNLSDDDGGGFLTAIGDQINTDPMLGPLQDNGGPSFTHELLQGSPAIDAGDPNFTPPPDYDQRGPGYNRLAHGRVDIGAFEVQTVVPAYSGQVQPPINTDGTSAFNANRGVVPVKFNLTQGGVATCDLPPATIAVTRTGGGVTGQVNESIYSNNADTGSNFRIDSCQYVYNLNSRALGAGIYRIDILINGQVVGSTTFELR